VEADTVKRTRFFHAIDHRDKKSIFTICREENVSLSTGKKWLRQRKKLESAAASRRVGKNRAGRPVKVTPDQLNEMLDVKKNPVRDQA
jgi:transposase